MKFVLILILTQSNLLKIQQEIKNTYEKVLPNVVKVVLENKIGSGIIYDTTGTIVTSLPLPFLSECEIINFKGEISTGKLLYWDDITHLAFFKSNFYTDEIKKEKNIEIGDFVLIVSNTLDFENTLFLSFISNKRKERVYLQGIPSIIATGSPVFSVNGKFIGIVKGEVIELEGGTSSRLFPKGYNIISVIPWEEIDEIKEKIRTENFKIPGWIGVLIKNEEGNVLVKRVLKGSPAERADIRPGDVILEIEKEKIDNIKQLIEKIRLFSPGQEIEMKIKRKNKIEVKKIKLEKIPPFIVY